MSEKIKITKQDLINDLKKQIEEHGKEYPDSKLTLNISNCEIDFEFDFFGILVLLQVTKKDKYNYLICPYNISFMNTTFNQGVFFISTTFSQDLLFHNTTFSQFTGFMAITFSQNVVFEHSTFEQKALFANIKFEQTIRFNNIIMNTDKSTLIFSSIYYNDKTKKFLDTPENSTIAITNTVMNGRIDFNDVHTAKLNLEGSNVTGILNRINLKEESENWETACILKNEELKRNNTIKALEYQAEEKKLYTEELWKNKQWGDWFSLWLGKIFHNHGQNWVLAFFWTMFILVLSFTCFYLPNPITDWSVWAYKFSGGIYFSELFQYLVPTDYKQIQGYFIIKELSFCTKFLGAFWYMIGKMVLPYGVYEVIKAFRKYK